jgi:hypothetical protein
MTDKEPQVIVKKSESKTVSYIFPFPKIEALIIAHAKEIFPEFQGFSDRQIKTTIKGEGEDTEIILSAFREKSS